MPQKCLDVFAGGFVAQSLGFGGRKHGLCGYAPQVVSLETVCSRLIFKRLGAVKQGAAVLGRVQKGRQLPRKIIVGQTGYNITFAAFAAFYGHFHNAVGYFYVLFADTRQFSDAKPGHKRETVRQFEPVAAQRVNLPADPRRVYNFRFAFRRVQSGVCTGIRNTSRKAEAGISGREDTMLTQWESMKSKSRIILRTKQTAICEKME